MTSRVTHKLGVVLAAFTMAAALASAAQSGSPGAALQRRLQDDQHPTLPAGDGRDVMIRVCSQCHEPEKVVGQENDERGWKELVDQMASNGAQASDEELATIVKYLAKAFPPK